jgi:PHD/YefM family antitoxin component YafN of YafNO toxin-antitoxin module
MKAQIIEKHGNKEFAIIPYKDFLRMQESLEDYFDLRDLRKAKVDPMNQQGRSFVDVAKELGLKKKTVL